MCMEIADLHELILCVSEGVLSVLLYNHIEGMETFGPHVQNLYVSEGYVSL